MESASMLPAAEWRWRLSPLVVAWFVTGALGVRTPSAYSALESSQEVVMSPEIEPTGSAPTTAASSIAVCAIEVTSSVTGVAVAHSASVGRSAGAAAASQSPSASRSRVTAPRFAALEPVWRIGRVSPSSPGTAAW